MKKKFFKLLPLILIIALLFYVEPILAGPGGTVVKALFKTWWGKLLMLLLTIIILPLIIYSKVIEFFKIRKTKKQLVKVGMKNKDFSWLNLNKNISNIFTRTYEAWSNEDMSEVKNYVNNWYWQNQQLVVLNKWEKDNVKNICNLESIKKIKPLYIEITNPSENFKYSKIAVMVTASIEDYLINRDSNKIVKGGRGYIDESHIWILEYDGKNWLLDNIANEDNSLAYLKTKNLIPEKLLINI